VAEYNGYMKVKVSKIIDWAGKNKVWMKRAGEEFFGSRDVHPGIENYENITALFGEWLIFEFKPKENLSVAGGYFFKNPDNWFGGLRFGLEQVLETEYVDVFEIGTIKKGEWMELYSVSRGETIRVYDRLGSLNCPKVGIMVVRVAKIGDRWYVVGSNPACLPITYTDRMKKMLLDGSKKKKEKMSAKDMVEFWWPKSNEKRRRMWPKKLTTKQIKNKRKKIKMAVERLICQLLK